MNASKKGALLIPGCTHIPEGPHPKLKKHKFQWFIPSNTAIQMPFKCSPGFMLFFIMLRHRFLAGYGFLYIHCDCSWSLILVRFVVLYFTLNIECNMMICPFWLIVISVLATKYFSLLTRVCLFLDFLNLSTFVLRYS